MDAGARAVSKLPPNRWTLILSLPIVVATIWLAFAAAAHLSRNRLVAQLNAQIDEGKPDVAVQSVRQMARMTDPPLDALVAAAASANDSVAQAARSSIDGLLDVWVEKIAIGYASATATANLQALAAALDEHRKAFPTTDHSWLADITQKIVRLANRSSAGDASGIALHCESVLAMTGPQRNTVPQTSTMSADRATGQAPQSVASNAGHAGTTRTAVPSTMDNIFNSPPQSALRSIARDDQSDAARAFDSKSRTRTPNRIDSNWNPRWERRDADDTASGPQLASPSTSDASSDGFKSTIGESSPAARDPKPPAGWEKYDSRKLLETWLSARGNAKFAMEHELARRGFTPLSPELVRPLLSTAAADRIQFVHHVIEVPGIDAKSWLTLLADDQDADVRLEAVTVMATSKDPDLIEKAWQAALHDHDPRIASLAARLRDRHSGTQRR
jgi:hypothetical protein